MKYVINNILIIFTCWRWRIIASFLEFSFAQINFLCFQIAGHAGWTDEWQTQMNILIGVIRILGQQSNAAVYIVFFLEMSTFIYCHFKFYNVFQVMSWWNFIDQFANCEFQWLQFCCVTFSLLDQFIQFRPCFLN